MSATELRADSVGLDVAGRRLLEDVSFTLGAGKLLVLTGPSGSGKTTLAHALAGLRRPDRGAITLAGVAVTELSLTARPVLVPQDFALVSVLSATESVALALQVRAVDRGEIRERCAHWLGALGLASCAGRLVSELSGGQRQRVAIARALAVGAAVIVMDEPTVELDPANRALVLSLLDEQLAHGAAIVVVSHESDVITRADQVYDLVAPADDSLNPPPGSYR